MRLEARRAAVEVAPGIGGRLSALEVDGWSLLRPDGPSSREWGCFVMAPWIGRLRDAGVAWAERAWRVQPTEPPHAMHRAGRGHALAARASIRPSVRLETTLGPDWPPGGRLIHLITLEEDRLRLRLEVHADREPTPAIIGWHPWFARRALRITAVGPEAIARASLDDVLRPGVVIARPRPGDVEVIVDAERRVALDADGLPTGALIEPRDDPRDDVLLGVTTPPVVRWPGGPTLRLVAGGVAAWIAYTAHPDGVLRRAGHGPAGRAQRRPAGRAAGRAVARQPLVATLDITWG